MIIDPIMGVVVGNKILVAGLIIIEMLKVVKEMAVDQITIIIAMVRAARVDNAVERIMVADLIQEVGSLKRDIKSYE